MRSGACLTEREATAFIAVPRNSGHRGNRDGTLILLAYRHGLRVSELVTLRSDQVDLSQVHLHVSPG